MSDDDEFTGRPELRVTRNQLASFSDHVTQCLQCRANVIAAWSVSMDVTDTLDGLCEDGMTLIASHIVTGPPAEGGPS